MDEETEMVRRAALQGYALLTAGHKLCGMLSLGAGHRTRVVPG